VGPEPRLTREALIVVNPSLSHGADVQRARSAFASGGRVCLTLDGGTQ